MSRFSLVRSFSVLFWRKLHPIAEFSPYLTKMSQPNEKSASITEKETTIQGLETWLSTTPVRVVVTETTSLSDKDEAFEFLQNNPRRDELLQEGRDILDDPVKSRKLLRKIDLTIIPLLALTYFLQALDKVALEVRPCPEAPSEK